MFWEVTAETLRASLALYDDFIKAVADGDVERKLPGIRSSTVGAQLWCVIGARESYARALDTGSWQGFACSVGGEDVRNRAALAGALGASASAVAAAVDRAAADPTDDR